MKSGNLPEPSLDSESRALRTRTLRDLAAELARFISGRCEGGADAGSKFETRREAVSRVSATVPHA